MGPLVWDFVPNKTLFPLLPLNKPILAPSITFPSQSDRSPVYLEDGNLPLAPPREYILVITSVSHPRREKRELGENKNQSVQKKLLSLWLKGENYKHTKKVIFNLTKDYDNYIGD